MLGADFMLSTLFTSLALAVSQEVQVVDPRAILRPGSPVRLVPDTVGTAAAGTLRPPLEIVEQGTEDTDELSTTLRMSPLDPRLPTGFQRVYRVPGSDTLLMRGNGALFAVFEQSVYTRDSKRKDLAVPAGTVFHIGMPGPQHTVPDPAPTNASVKGRIDARISARVDPRANPRVESRVESRVDARVNKDSVSTAETAVDAQTQRRSDATRAPLTVNTTANIEVSHDTQGNLAPISIDPNSPYAHLRLGPPRITRAE
jgi:hypothetical protein